MDDALKMQGGIKMKPDCFELCEGLADVCTCDTDTHTQEDAETERRLKVEW